MTLHALLTVPEDKDGGRRSDLHLGGGAGQFKLWPSPLGSRSQGPLALAKVVPSAGRLISVPLTLKCFFPCEPSLTSLPEANRTHPNLTAYWTSENCVGETIHEVDKLQSTEDNCVK